MTRYWLALSLLFTTTLLAAPDAVRAHCGRNHSGDPTAGAVCEGTPSAQPATAPVAAASASALAPAFDAYFALVAALAADNLDGAKAAVANLVKASETLTDPTTAALKKAASAMASLNDLAALRDQPLADLSVAVIALDQRQGPVGGGPHYVIRCPMAFENRGADWLQRDNKVANPYFGSKMPTCGLVTTTIGKE